MAVTPFSNKDLTLFAETNFRNQRKPFGIKRADREKHMYVLGKTGMGKTSMLARMIVQDMNAGEAVVLIDVTGGLSEQMVHYVPETRLKETVYWNPADREHPFLFNCLDDIGSDEERHTLTGGLVHLFHELWRDVWGPRLEYVLTNVLLTLMYNKNMTLLHILPLLTDAKFRARAVERISDPVLAQFWTREFGEEGEGFLRPAIDPIRDKMGQLIGNPILRNTIGVPRSRFRLDDFLNQKKIVICSFNKHEIGADASKFLGSAFLLRLLMRAKAHPAPRDVYLYIDEFHEVAFRGFEEFVGSSGHGMRFILSHQYLSQISETMREAIFGSAGTIITFRVGSSDTAFLADEFGPGVSENHLTTLPPHTIILKLLIDGKVSAPFSAVTLPPLPKVGLKERIIVQSRALYSEPRKEVEAEIARCLGMRTDGADESAPVTVVWEPKTRPTESVLAKFREKIAAVTLRREYRKEEPNHEESVKKSEKVLRELAPGDEVLF